MSVNEIAERRRIRRKLTFWRIVAFLIIGAAIVLFWLFVNGGELTASTERAHIARVTISGVIQDDNELLERLDRIAKKDSAKALIVSISSPGGTTYGGEMIYKALRKVAEKKPVVADIRTLAASAGYMVAIGGDRIVAGDTSITGSVGVIFQYPQLRNLLDKLGVSLEEIKSAPLKAEPSPFHPATEEAKSVMREMVMDSYDWFVDRVAERRKLTRADALKLADGRVFTGRQALKAKLVDDVGGMPQILAYLENRKVNKDLPVIDWKAPRSGSPFLLGGMMRQLLQWSGLAWLEQGTSMDDKLLLDGLVSVWQFER